MSLTLVFVVVVAAVIVLFAFMYWRESRRPHVRRRRPGALDGPDEPAPGDHGSRGGPTRRG
ncbi:hypothetical protein [Geodermatophilus sabuli]|uniref:Uncharacterized protein n=1 Tax=Geodermatophilus sabuli TaxID=1564158 RepID=A0A285EE92_9ACTN|nr:hypothetical protein [Geodermatophilus sabuli]MBB3084361.1 Flp pilus assembly protein TadB [Geodermatophilus sabuli]SNX96371.1 hypothetical protein SAMN06893097_10485 [Geodermatophilus sabuli]